MLSFSFVFFFSLKVAQGRDQHSYSFKLQNPICNFVTSYRASTPENDREKFSGLRNGRDILLSTNCKLLLHDFLLRIWTFNVVWLIKRHSIFAQSMKSTTKMCSDSSVSINQAWVNIYSLDYIFDSYRSFVNTETWTSNRVHFAHLCSKSSSACCI